MLAEGPQPRRRVNVLGRYLTGRVSGVHDWPVLGVHRGYTDLEQDQLIIRQHLVKVLTEDGIKVVVTQYSDPPRPEKDSS